MWALILRTVDLIARSNNVYESDEVMRLAALKYADQQLAQAQVALAVLHQQQQAADVRRLGAQPLHAHVGADDGLDAGAAGGLVELDRAEEAVQVGDRQRRLAVGSRRRHGVVDAAGAIDDGKFGVQAQVDKHALIVGRRRQSPCLKSVS